MQDIRKAYEEYFHTVYGFLMGLTGGDDDLAEELTQETFYQHLDYKKRHGEIPLEDMTETGIGEQLEQKLIAVTRNSTFIGKSKSFQVL